MKTNIGILLLSALSAFGQVHDLQYTKRAVNGITVNLTPLADWEGGPPQERPLKAWKHITGTKVGNVGRDWVVLAKVEGGTRRRILLRNPPLTELQEFGKLKAEYDALLHRREQLLGANAQLASDHTQAVQGKVGLENTRATRPGDSRGLARAGAALGREAGQDSRLMRANHVELGALNGQIKSLDRYGYNLAGDFPISCFALEIQQTSQDLPVYDRGLISK